MAVDEKNKFIDLCHLGALRKVKDLHWSFCRDLDGVNSPGGRVHPFWRADERDVLSAVRGIRVPAYSRRNTFKVRVSPTVRCSIAIHHACYWYTYLGFQSAARQALGAGEKTNSAVWLITGIAKEYLPVNSPLCPVQRPWHIDFGASASPVGARPLVTTSVRLVDAFALFLVRAPVHSIVQPHEGRGLSWLQ
jgi:hypothetical protein